MARCHDPQLTTESEKMSLILITGAAGRIGKCLREGLKQPGRTLRLTDVADLGEAVPGEQCIEADLSDPEAARQLTRGADAVVHLAGLVGADLRWKDVSRNNIETTYNVFEAARQEGVSRVVFASSIHFHGFLRRGVQGTAAAPYRPDSLYGVAKVFGEALGRMYADKYAVQVVCLRIASFRPRPTIARELGTWLSPGDAVRLFEASLTAPNVHFEILYGTSKNSLGLYDHERSAEMGYLPQDDSSQYAAEIAKSAANKPEAELEALFHGAHFIPPGFSGKVERL
jgi:uronate dehydrogenase